MASKTVKTYCRYCHANCGILVEIAEGRAIQVRGDRDNAMTRGFTCIKGRSLPDQHAHEDRLRGSLKREGPGRLAPIAVDTAQDEIAASPAREGDHSKGDASMGTHGYHCLRQDEAAEQEQDKVVAVSGGHFFLGGDADQGGKFEDHR